MIQFSEIHVERNSPVASRPISPTVECFVEKDGKYLLLKRSADKKILPDIWIAPGGHREFNEGVIAATRREIKEETGLDIKNIKIKVTGTALLEDINVEFAFHVLTAEYAGGELITNPSDGEFAWLSAEEISSLDTLLSELRPLVPRIFYEDRTLSVRVVYAAPDDMTAFEIEDVL